MSSSKISESLISIENQKRITLKNFVPVNFTTESLPSFRVALRNVLALEFL